MKAAAAANGRPKGAPRRTKKIVPKNSGGDEKKLQSVLKKLQVNPVGAIEKVFFVYDNDKIQVFDQPKVGAGQKQNTFVVAGKSEMKNASEVEMKTKWTESDMAEILQRQMQQRGMHMPDNNDDQIPDLVDNFDDVADEDDGDEAPEKAAAEEIDE
eukprot:CAMPEP_0204576426 /NCGR_PEP_ID=MMETSP0661-20131031/41768_1 /ASSEMBLY_ACC=CAM_ASM_000606 /TAXON_ID=109239 /ORGANISM="Alexandrium margalefi, Strain AMGDE01CS-322" /LENGTH=155 /DNA_ID=CAMNT_0051585173 /DNA_START=1 /DNA_END=468 /DNA_ORIENTATION=+